MDETTTTTATTTTNDATSAPALPAHVLEACEIAATGAEPPDRPQNVRAAHCDYSARGRRREHWYRMVWRDNQWQYYARERLVRVGMLASTRHQTVYGTVWPGEILVQHDHGGPVDVAWLVVDHPKECLVRCELSVTRRGELKITLPDGRTVVRPNPRRS
jgi:hypothetical protein